VAQERGAGREAFGLNVGLGHAESGGHRTNFLVEKWDLDQIKWATRKDYDGQRLIRPGVEPIAADFARLKCKPFESVLAEDCNNIQDAGWQMLMNGVAGSAVTKFASGVGRIGLGSGAYTAGNYADTGLTSVTNITGSNWKPLNATPTVSSTHTGGLILGAQFATTEANDSTGSGITEFGVDLGTTATGPLATIQTAPFFSHGACAAGQKTSVQTWNATVTYTWT
jgi:hypothetical protein